MKKALKCVLLIDDDIINNALHKIYLSDAGVAKQIETAETVKEALERLESSGDHNHQKPELIFLDLNMPGLTGWDFIDEYKKLKDRQQLDSVIVVLTASANPDDGNRARSIGEVNEFRNKPMTFEMIDEIVQKYFTPVRY